MGDKLDYYEEIKRKLKQYGSYAGPYSEPLVFCYPRPQAEEEE